jgi:hypothetical protein
MKRYYLVCLFLLISNLSLTSQDSQATNDKQNPTLYAPLKMGGNNLLHSLILIPQLESAELTPPGKSYIQSGMEYDTGNFRREKKDWLFDYDANLIETFVNMRYGVSNNTELSLNITRGSLVQDKRDLLLFKDNFGYFSGERSAGLSDLVLGVKLRLMGSSKEEDEMPYTSSLGVWWKKPMAKKENVLSSGGNDFAIAYIETSKISENLFTHTQIGITFTGKENVFKDDISISNPVFYGAGLGFIISPDTVLIGQVQGNTNAFDKIKALDKNPLSVQGGFRYNADNHIFAEFGAGFGLTDASSDFTTAFSVGLMF